MKLNRKVILIILDGWGIGKNPKVSAVAHSNTPNMDRFLKNYPNSTLQASEEAVGLPVGQMGNSEVGHLNIGAGRIVYQDLMRINNAFQNKTINHNQVLSNAFELAKTQNKKVHFLGLVSDGGVHSSIAHLKGLCTIAHENGIKNLYIHCFTDGRDTDPKSGIRFVKELHEHTLKTTGKIASICGRYYAMDRDKRWERIKLAYNLLVKGEAALFNDLETAFNDTYNKGITDEFIKPVSLLDNGKPVLISDGDIVLSFNFRKDRMRHLTQVLTQKDMAEFGMKTLDLHYVTMALYDENFKNINVIFKRDDPKMTLGEVLEINNKKQIRIAETEKYPHVTFFFSGGREAPFTGETRILCPSPKVATYDLKPEMSAYDIQDRIIPELEKQEADFICLNFANPDMVGHTGVFKAVVKACETVDSTTGKVVEAALKNNYTSLIIADHGNAEIMLNDDGTPNTAHTTNLVPFILIDKDFKPKLKDGKLCDLAPTILKLMGIDIPEVMTGESLIYKSL